MHEPIRTYREFWPHYLREHAKPETRAVHLVGTGIAAGSLIAFVLTRRLWLVPLAFFGGYGPAWSAHFFIEKNRPATFTYPLWSLISDFRMAATWLTGGLSREVADAKADSLTRS